MQKKNELRKLQQKIVPILKSNNVARAGIFGSYARGEATKNISKELEVNITPPINGTLYKPITNTTRSDNITISSAAGSVMIRFR